MGNKKYPYEVILWEDKLSKVRDQKGFITHHPLYGLYTMENELRITYGHLSFAGHNLGVSPLFGDLKVFYLEFSGNDDEAEDDRESWADPLRLEVLKRLCTNQNSWYLSLVGWMPDKRTSSGFIPLEEYFQETIYRTERLNFASISSEKQWGYGLGFAERMFTEVPNEYLETFFTRYWEVQVPGDTIEGYNLVSGRMDLLKKWNDMPRDDELFREVLNECFIAFYTFPSENRHFVFLTNKLTLEQFQDVIGFKNLQEKAEHMS